MSVAAAPQTQATAQSQPPTHMTGMALWLAAITLAVSNFMVVLDTTIANVSVPHIAGSLGFRRRKAFG